MDIYWEIDKEVQAGHYNHMVKEHCAWCNAFMEIDMERYLQRGNCCLPCTIRFNRVVEGVREYKPNGSRIKLREYTDEEKMSVLFIRLREVEEKKLYKKLDAVPTKSKLKVYGRQTTKV